LHFARVPSLCGIDVDHPQGQHPDQLGQAGPVSTGPSPVPCNAIASRSLTIFLLTNSTSCSHTSFSPPSCGSLFQFFPRHPSHRFIVSLAIPSRPEWLPCLPCHISHLFYSMQQ
jgi:hypothetical protein